MRGLSFVTIFFLSIPIVWITDVKAGFTVRVDYSETSSGVPLGDTLLRNGTTILLNYSGVAGQPNEIDFGDERPDRNISVTLFADPLRIQASDTSTLQFQDLNVNTTVSLRTKIDSYSRQLFDGTVKSTTVNETFTVEDHYNLKVKFGYAANSAIAQYQYFFQSGLPDLLSDGRAPLDVGDFYTTDPNAVIPWDVIKHYGTGTNFVGTVRAVDLAGFYNESTFDFDIHPTSVPEPGSLVLATMASIGLALRIGWKRRWERRGKDLTGDARDGDKSQNAT